MLLDTATDGVCRLLGERKLRVLRAEQVARTWFLHTQDPKRSATACLRKLARKGLVEFSSAMLHPEIIDVSTPLFAYEPGDEPPDFGRLSWRAQSRFTESPIRTAIATAGPELIPRHRPLRATEILHDTVLSSVFLHLFSSDHTVFERWQHEDEQMDASAQHARIPDAILFDGKRETFIECIGTYSAEKLTAIHNAFQNVPYRLY